MIVDLPSLSWMIVGLKYSARRSSRTEMGRGVFGVEKRITEYAAESEQ